MTKVNSISGLQVKAVDYQEMPLVQLLERIILLNDKNALNELHENRTLFKYRDKDLLLVDYLVRLADVEISRKWCDHNQVTLDKAFDLTLSKFMNIPQKHSKSCGQTGTDGPDCRYYYRACHAYIIRQIAQKQLSDTFEVEIMAAGMLQNFVARHFFLSCLESVRRESKTTRRYWWKSNGDAIVLWMPMELTASQCQKWLSENVPDADPRRDYGRQRVQQIIDSRLGRRNIVSLNGHIADAIEMPGTDAICSAVTEQISIDGLAQTVASEKVDNIASQRPSIKVLGKDKLRKLVLMIFDNLLNGGRAYAHILEKFSLSQGSLNRFAGSRWHTKQGDNTSIPDLWKNTAHLLARHTHFIEAARQAGVWKKIREVTET